MGANQRRAAGWTLDRLVAWVCSAAEVDPERVRAGGRSARESRARALIGWLAIRELGFTLAEVSRTCGVTPGPMSRSLRRGERIAAESPRSLPFSPPGGPASASHR